MVTGSLLPRPLPRAAAFSMLAGVLFLMFMASAAPSPLYRVYQGEWRFSATPLTGVFAVYALILLVTLLFFRSVSGFLGPPPVIARGPGLPARTGRLFPVGARGRLPLSAPAR